MNRLLMATVGLLCLVLMSSSACTVSEGENCQIDSDCAPGTLCSRDGLCATYEQVAAELADVGAAPYVPGDTQEPGDTNGSSQDTDTIAADIPSGDCSANDASIFTVPSDAPCAEPTMKKKVALLQVAPSGHGAATVAEIGNSIIQAGFDEGQIPLAMWVDGSFEDGCEWGIAWIRDDADILDDCTAKFTDTMPFSIPQLVDATIYNAVFDPSTNRVTGILNREELLASIDPSIRETAGNFFINDVDTDGDGTLDHTSIILELTFEE